MEAFVNDGQWRTRKVLGSQRRGLVKTGGASVFVSIAKCTIARNYVLCIRLIVHFTDQFCFNGLYNYILGRPILSLSQLPGEYSALNTGLTAGA